VLRSRIPRHLFGPTAIPKDYDFPRAESFRPSLQFLKIAKRLFQKNPAPFNVYLLQTLMEDAEADEGEELLVRL